MTDNLKALEIQNLSYIYRGNWLIGKQQALGNITLDVLQGEAFGFLGHNGAGKTTAIKCILRLVRPQQGQIKIFGEDNKKTASRREVGYLPEQPYFYDHLTVGETMELYAHLAGLERSAIGAAIEWALDLVKVSARRKSPLRSLSKGLTQRVAMAQAIIARPRLLILDEPFSGLDPVGRKEFRDLLSMLHREGTTLFMSSHILNDVQLICSRVSIMVRGEIKGVFDTAQVSQGGEHGLEDLFMQLVQAEQTQEGLR